MVEMKNWSIPQPIQERIDEHLRFLYGPADAAAASGKLGVILADFHARLPELASREAVAPLTERDAILITYGDQVQEPGRPPLRTLHEVLVGTLNRVVSGVHILPFFPYSSDDGFSVIDYTQVDPGLGTWEDVELLGEDFRLMFDAVVNHISRSSEWFQRFLAGDPRYENWFIAFEPDAPLDWVPQVTRPRPWPLLTPVQTASGEKLVWTTFSEDQIDLNFAYPPVLLRMLEVLLLYVERGAQIIRLDAIAYLWKRAGTSCIHLEETHRVVKLMRLVLDAVAPGVVLITETNVPHEENISYFGDALDEGSSVPGRSGTDEAQMVYQFPLAPLVMHSLLSGSAEALSDWAASLGTPAPGATFFNFTASHDGVGVRPAEGLLEEKEVQRLVDATQAHGGQVSYKTNPDGTRSVYELNISYFDALSDPAAGEPLETQLKRFICSQAIMLALAGVPGVYAHSLLGSRSWQDGAALTGQPRTINRQKFERLALERELADPSSLRHKVLNAYSRLLRARASDRAFHPQGGQRVLALDPHVFALLRTSTDARSQVLCLHNVSGRLRRVALPEGDPGSGAAPWEDLISGESYPPDGDGLVFELEPYAVRWLKT